MRHCEKRHSALANKSRVHRTYMTTSTLSDDDLPCVSGVYISSAYAGGAKNTPTLVARAVYENTWVPGDIWVVNASARSVRRFRC
mmetsp:Transcript_903/g.2353  ORF Transcript_903/g.2353 Transcript_903/m.2353 type:complete len:85 (+) Transcript_903:54-308(+)